MFEFDDQNADRRSIFSAEAEQARSKAIEAIRNSSTFCVFSVEGDGMSCVTVGKDDPRKTAMFFCDVIDHMSALRDRLLLEVFIYMMEKGEGNE